MKKYIRCFEKIKETVFESRKGVGKIIKLTDHWGYPAYILFDVNGDYVDRDIDPNKLHRKLWDMKPQVVDIESSTSIKCSKVIDFTEHTVTKDDVSDADWDQLQHTVNFDYYDSLQQMAQDLVNVIEDDQVWSEVEWNIFHAWYDEKGFTDDDWDYVEACGYERDQF